MSTAQTSPTSSAQLAATPHQLHTALWWRSCVSMVQVHAGQWHGWSSQTVGRVSSPSWGHRRWWDVQPCTHQTHWPAVTSAPAGVSRSATKLSLHCRGAGRQARHRHHLEKHAYTAHANHLNPYLRSAKMLLSGRQPDVLQFAFLLKQDGSISLAIWHTCNSRQDHYQAISALLDHKAIVWDHEGIQIPVGRGDMGLIYIQLTLVSTQPIKASKWRCAWWYIIDVATLHQGKQITAPSRWQILFALPCLCLSSIQELAA